jgi:hypothetical protein
MQATVVILVGSLVAISGYAAYTHLVLPQPVELGKSSGMPPAPPPLLPTPEPPAQIGPHALPPTVVTVSPAPSMPEPQAVAIAVAPRAPANAAPAPPPPQVAASAPSAARSPLDPALSAQLASASTLYVAGRTKDALAAYERVLSAQPDVPEALGRVAFIELNTHHSARARELATRAVELDSTNSEAWIVLGAARAALGDHRGAREAYRSCAEQSVGEYALECRRLAR